MDTSDYNAECKRACEDAEAFWGEKGRELLSWSKPFGAVYRGSFGSDRWFEDGELNACYNCVDRWVEVQPDKTAFIFDRNNGESARYTYREVQLKVFEVCHELRHLEKGDCVTAYLSMSPFAVFTALACARLGLVHNFVFGGFSAEALHTRIMDSRSKLLVTQDFAYRGEKKIELLSIAAQATKDLPALPILVFDYQSMAAVPSGPEASRSPSCAVEDSYLNNEFANQDIGDLLANRSFRLWSLASPCQEYVPCVSVGSEHHLFYLYTSGSTGSPKGLIHSTAGYLAYVAYSLKTAFSVRENDVFCCTADIGWITGHSYCLYAPLVLGITSVILEGIPTYPSHYRFFNIVDKYSITQLYTAPTTIRVLKMYFDTHEFDLSAHSLGSLRLLGTVGEPINTEAYRWFGQSFGGCHIVDTYFQTETGGILIAPIPGVREGIPECAAFPVPGIVPVICHQENDAAETPLPVRSGQLGKVFMRNSWPGITRGILNDPERFRTTYFGNSIYFTGDEGLVDGEGLFWIKGRTDDVINVSGHRISTAEVESTACSNEIVAEAAIVAVRHPIKGQCMLLFVVLKRDDPLFVEKIQSTISSDLGGFCRPEKIISCPGIPKTATGKIMRRVLRAIASDEKIGDLSTCVNREVVAQLQGMSLKEFCSVD